MAAAITHAGGHGLKPQEKFARMRQDMSLGLIEREDETDVVLTALVANHHPLLVGEPGTAKSLLGRAVADWLDGRQFEVLLSKHTDPAELFGPVSIEGLKKDEYRRITDGTLVDAEIGFLDEIFKASPAILNTILGVLNERRYRNGKSFLTCPLVMSLAASNEWPQDSETGGKELGALFDRFLFRKVVKPIRSTEGEDRLLWSPKLGVELSTRITAAEIATARKEAESLLFSEEAKAGFVDILRKLEEEGICPGDRRKRWSVSAVKSFAYMSGAPSVEKDHLEILSHTLWVDPREQPEKTAQVVAKVANPLGMIVNELLGEARDVVKKTNAKEFASLLPASKKMEEIAGKLKAIKDNPKAATALRWVSSQAKSMRAKFIEGGGG